MKILAIDTSGPNCSASIISESTLIGQMQINIGKTHSETLLPLVDQLLASTQLSLQDMDAFACSIGPGSFTGIRIGIATIKGFALGTQKPVIPVTTLESLAYNVPTCDGIICSVLNANNGNVYAGFYDMQKEYQLQGDYQTGTIEELIEQTQNFLGKVYFVGDGAIYYREKIEQALGEKAQFLPLHCNEQSALSLARVALQKWNHQEFQNGDDIHPLYLRKSQAERLAEEDAQSS